MTRLAFLLIVVLSRHYFDPRYDPYMMKAPILRMVPDCPEPNEGIFQ